MIILGSSIHDRMIQGLQAYMICEFAIIEKVSKNAVDIDFLSNHFYQIYPHKLISQLD